MNQGDLVYQSGTPSILIRETQYMNQGDSLYESG